MSFPGPVPSARTVVVEAVVMNLVRPVSVLGQVWSRQLSAGVEVLAEQQMVVVFEGARKAAW